MWLLCNRRYFHATVTTTYLAVSMEVRVLTSSLTWTASRSAPASVPRPGGANNVPSTSAREYCPLRRLCLQFLQYLYYVYDSILSRNASLPTMINYCLLTVCYHDNDIQFLACIYLEVTKTSFLLTYFVT